MYLLTCRQKLFYLHVKLMNSYRFFSYLCTPFSLDSQGCLHTLFVRICRKRGVWTAGCRIACLRFHLVISRARKPINPCVPAPQSSRKTELWRSLIPPPPPHFLVRIYHCAHQSFTQEGIDRCLRQMSLSLH